MSQPYILNSKIGLKTSEDTTDYPPNGKKVSASRPACKLARPGSSTASTTNDISGILRQRLLLASMIIAAGFTIFFIRHLINPDDFLGVSTWNQVVQGVGAAALVLIATILASHLPLTIRQLRAIELVLFGVLAGYFAWLQMVMFSGGRVLEWARPEAEAHVHILRLANAANLMRWFNLIVIYGTFVPNTWKRCAIMVGILAIIPLGLMAMMCFGCRVMGPYALQFALDSITLLGIASAISIFGSWKISELREEASHARRLGQYQLKELIGSGGMGEVYLGEHMMLRRACAIKLIRPDQAGDATNLSRFEREVRAMATLTHWNTVEVYDYGHAEDGTFYYVMEYLPGLSLQELVDKYGPLSSARTIHFLRQICDALSEAHSIGLIHRDIKPSNVLATERGNIYDVAKLLDFGLVQSVGITHQDSRLTVQGVVLGSPPYMSPEQALGKDLDSRTDIYSVGGLGYYLLTGQAPFERDAPMQVLMAHVYEKVRPISELRPDVPADLEAVIMKCLSKDPDDRYADAESLQEALGQCDAAGTWDRHDAADWWRMHQQKEKTVAVAVA